MEGTTNRIQAVDWLRGLVMVLMTGDHASAAFNAGRLFHRLEVPVPAPDRAGSGQFLTRWITHLCAPDLPATMRCTIATAATS
jgi:uncharacterized membrane protein